MGSLPITEISLMKPGVKMINVVIEFWIAKFATESDLTYLSPGKEHLGKKAILVGSTYYRLFFVEVFCYNLYYLIFRGRRGFIGFSERLP